MAIINFIFLVISTISFFSNAKGLKNLIHYSWWAQYQSALKNKNQASSWFDDVLSSDSSLCTRKGYIQHLYRHEQYHDLIKYYQAAEKGTLDQDFEIKKMYGLSLMRIGDSAVSDVALLQLASDGPDDLELCFYAAQAYMRKGEYENALILIDRYLNNENKEAGIFILYFLKSQLCLQLNRLIDAKKACQEAVLLRPDFEKGWLLLAMLAEQEGDFSSAISGYKQYLALDAQSAIDSGVYNGILAAIARNFFLQQTHEKKHFNDSVIVQKAQTSFKNKQYSEAIGYANQLLSDSSSNLDMICLKIEALVELEQYDAVVNCLLEQIEKFPTDKGWYKVLGWSFQYGTVDHSTIISRLKKIQEKNLQTVLPGLYIVDYYCNNGMFEDAQNLFSVLDQSIADPFLKCILSFRLADMYKQQKKFDKMIDQLSTILTIQPDNDKAYELLAEHFIAQKDYAKALDIINQWRVLHALCPRALTKHGFVFYKQGRYDDASDLFNQVNATHKTPFLFLCQAKVLRKKGLYDQAIVFCTQAKNSAMPEELEQIDALLEKLKAESPRQPSN